MEENMEIILNALTTLSTDVEVEVCPFYHFEVLNDKEFNRLAGKFDLKDQKKSQDRQREVSNHFCLFNLPFSVMNLKSSHPRKWRVSCRSNSFCIGSTKLIKLQKELKSYTSSTNLGIKSSNLGRR